MNVCYYRIYMIKFVLMEIPKVSGYEPERIIKEATAYTNWVLSEGTPAYKVRSLIRAYPKPIAVDFNNVLANNIDPMSLNPDAPEFLQELQKIGNVFIVTTAPSWISVQEFLAENGAWSEKMILMAAPNLRFLAQSAKHLIGNRMRKEYLEIAQRNQISVRPDQLLGPLRDKRIAPIFAKPFLVPIIDDLPEAISNNPGMLGIQVEEWEPNYDSDAVEKSSDEIQCNTTLMEAVEMVRNHYSVLGRSPMTSEAVI